MASRHWHASQRSAAGHGAVDARFLRDASLPGRDGRSRGLHEAVDDARGVPAAPERAAPRVRVHREQRRYRALREAAEERPGSLPRPVTEAKFGAVWPIIEARNTTESGY